MSQESGKLNSNSAWNVQVFEKASEVRYVSVTDPILINPEDSWISQEIDQPDVESFGITLSNTGIQNDIASVRRNLVPRSIART
jgi:hypothetical protein